MNADAIVLILGYFEILRKYYPPYSILRFKPNFTGYDLDKKDINWYDTYLTTAPDDLVAYVRNTFYRTQQTA